MTNYWLLKSEPSCFSIDDLAQAPKQMTHWDGVRNYQARNFIRDQMHKGDQALFYHSNCNPPGIAGIVDIVSDGYHDFTAYDPTSEHPDPKSTPENPRWYMVDIRFKAKLPRLLSLEHLRQYPELESMLILRKGNRLSVTPVSAEEWNFITQKAV